MTTKTHGAIIYYPADGGAISRTVTAADVEAMERGQEFYRLRVEALQSLLMKMPEPWATLCADIVANGYPRYWGVGAFLKESEVEQ